MSSFLENKVFLSFIFILFFIILNVYIVGIIDHIPVVNSFFTLYYFWLFMIVVLFIISRSVTYSDKQED